MPSMNTQKSKISIFLIVIAILGIGGWLLWKGGDSYGRNNQSSSSTNTPPTNWNVYENTAYGYRFSYPSNMEVARVQDMDPRPITEVDDIYVSREGSELFVTIATGSLVALDIKSFAESVRQNQINNKNPNIKNKQVDELKTISFANKTAYSFTLSGGFITGALGTTEYGFEGTHNYIITENNAGEKIILHYPIEDSLSEQIKNSFEFTNR